MFVCIEKVRDHLILDESLFSIDQNYIQSLIDVSETIISQYLGYSDLEEFVILHDGILPSPIEHSILFLVANFYENREPLSNVNLSKNHYGIEYLISPYKKY